jgi:DnaJ-class molecular chaperone
MTHYDILQMPPGATHEQLHAHFLELAQKAHKNGNFAEGFAEVIGAWGILKDAGKRKEYDKQLAFDGHNCRHCEGRGLVFRYKKKAEVRCEHCKGTGRL